MQAKALLRLSGTILADLSRYPCNLPIGIILARLLDPEPFGLVAIALFVQDLGNLFAEGGLGSVLIQSQDINKCNNRSVFI